MRSDKKINMYIFGFGSTIFPLKFFILRENYHISFGDEITVENSEIQGLGTMFLVKRTFQCCPTKNSFFLAKKLN